MPHKLSWLTGHLVEGRCLHVFPKIFFPKLEDSFHLISPFCFDMKMSGELYIHWMTNSLPLFQAHLLSVFDNTKTVTFDEKVYDKILSVNSQEGENVVLEEAILAQVSEQQQQTKQQSLDLTSAFLLLSFPSHPADLFFCIERCMMFTACLP
jgi:hypothetical protein